MAIDCYYVSKYKCFVDSTKIHSPKLVNLIIGKNNSGKSSLLDVFKFLNTNKQINGLNGLTFFYKIEQKDIEHVRYYHHYNYVRDVNWNIITEPASKLDGLVIEGFYGFSGNSKQVQIDVKNIVNKYYNSASYEVQNVEFLSDKIKNHFKNNNIIVVAAERDIHSEKKHDGYFVDEHGNSFTSTLEYLAHNQHAKRIIIENILNSLNEIFDGDEHYDSLEILDNEGNYTIHLGEKHNEIPITDMGSGLKTLLIVLFHLEYAKLYNTNPIFMFEELENNLHPEMQRRLFNKIYDYAVDNNSQVFITTHSNVAINCLFNKDNTAIYHVKRTSDNKSEVFSISTLKDSYEILNDLGVKASDIFQTNGIIWVEGPSDRIYIKAWLKIIDPDLEENKHYSFLYYGGRNLAHFSADDIEGLINILLTNRCSAIIMDSDIKDKDNIRINSTKERVKKEFEDKQLFCWITEGREVENYISYKVIDKLYPEKTHEQIEQYEDFKDYIKDDNDSFDNNKVVFAKSLKFDNEEELDVLDLKEKVTKLASIIKGWNS